LLRRAGVEDIVEKEEMLAISEGPRGINYPLDEG
jgi:hypothetical protein